MEAEGNEELSRFVTRDSASLFVLRLRFSVFVPFIFPSSFFFVNDSRIELCRYTRNRRDMKTIRRIAIVVVDMKIF